MKGGSRKLFIASTAAAAFLALAAACGGEKAPTPTPTPNLGAPYSCVEPGKSQIAHLTPGVSFNVASLVDDDKLFASLYGSHVATGESDKSKFNCNKVINSGNYVVAIGEDSRVGDISVAYIFKNLASSPSGLGFVGAVPNFGLHKEVAVVPNYGDLGDLLIMASNILYDDDENGAMLDSMAQTFFVGGRYLRGFRDERNNDLNYGTKVVVYRLSDNLIAYDGNNFEDKKVEKEKERRVMGVNGWITERYRVRVFEPPVLEKIAAWPVLFGWDVEVESMAITQQNGKVMLELKTSEMRPDGNRYSLASGTVPLEQIIKGGIVTGVPLLKH